MSFLSKLTDVLLCAKSQLEDLSTEEIISKTNSYLDRYDILHIDLDLNKISFRLRVIKSK